MRHGRKLLISRLDQISPEELKLVLHNCQGCCLEEAIQQQQVGAEWEIEFDRFSQSKSEQASESVLEQEGQQQWKQSKAILQKQQASSSLFNSLSGSSLTAPPPPPPPQGSLFFPNSILGERSIFPFSSGGGSEKSQSPFQLIKQQKQKQAAEIQLRRDQELRLKKLNDEKVAIQSSLEVLTQQIRYAIQNFTGDNQLYNLCSCSFSLLNFQKLSPSELSLPAIQGLNSEFVKSVRYSIGLSSAQEKSERRRGLQRIVRKLSVYLCGLNSLNYAMTESASIINSIKLKLNSLYLAKLQSSHLNQFIGPQNRNALFKRIVGRYSVQLHPQNISVFEVQKNKVSEEQPAELGFEEVKLFRKNSKIS